MNTVTSLVDYREKKGLLPVREHIALQRRSLLELLLDRYRSHDPFAGRGVLPVHRFRQLATSCAKRIVKQVEIGKVRIGDDARFQFFGVGDDGDERLQVRVNRVGKAKRTLIFEINPKSFEAHERAEIGDGKSKMKPLLTLSMSPIYRLAY